MENLMSAIVDIIISILVSTGIATVILKFIVESALKDAHQKKKEADARKEEQYRVRDEWQDNVSSCIFWIHHGIKKMEDIEDKSYWNGELQNAIDNLNNTKNKQVEMERKQLSEINS